MLLATWILCGIFIPILIQMLLIDVYNVRSRAFVLDIAGDERGDASGTFRFGKDVCVRRRSRRYFGRYFCCSTSDVWVSCLGSRKGEVTSSAQCTEQPRNMSYRYIFYRSKHIESDWYRPFQVGCADLSCHFACPAVQRKRKRPTRRRRFMCRESCSQTMFTCYMMTRVRCFPHCGMLTGHKFGSRVTSFLSAVPWSSAFSIAAGQPIIAEPRVVEKLKEQGHIILNLMDAYRTKVQWTS